MAREIPQRHTVQRLAERADYDRETIYGIVDEALICHVGIADGDQPFVIPTLHARDGDRLLFHGLKGGRLLKHIQAGREICVAITLVDGIVLARSAFNSSMNYRSVTVFGTPSLVAGREDKLHAMRHISEHLMPGRWDELRAPHEREIKMTGVIALPIESASAKVSAGQPDDEEDDYRIPVWAGVLPVTTEIGALVTDERVIDGVSPSAAVRALQHRKI